MCVDEDHTQIVQSIRDLIDDRDISGTGYFLSIRVSKSCIDHRISEFNFETYFTLCS